MKYDCLNIHNQLCFPLYATSHQITKKYKPLLDKINLTYTQYITMMVLWERKQVNVKELGEILFLDSGTLTPLLKRLEKKGYLTRQRSLKDERSLEVTITPLGLDLQEQAKNVPVEISKCIPLSSEEGKQLYSLLYKVLNNIHSEDK